TYGWKEPAVRLLVLESFVTWGFFSWAWYAWQPYFLELYGKNAIWLSGLIASLFALAGIAGNALVGRLGAPLRRRTTIMRAAASSPEHARRPDHGRGPRTGPPSFSDSHRARNAAGQVIGSPSVRWIIDGMNVIGSRPDRWWNDPDRAVRRFIEEIDRYGSRTS